MASYKRLYRSETEKMLGGVCGGLAEYFNIDPSLARIIFAVLACAWGGGLLAYILLWIILPKKSKVNTSNIEDNVEEIKETANKIVKTIKKSSK